MPDLSSKRYVVTGVASGIGDALARRLAAAGAEVTSLDRNAPSAPVAEHIEVDLVDPHSIHAAVARCAGRFDAVVNVAGVPRTLPADVVFAVNALAVREISEAFFDRLTPGGSITVVSSIAGNNWPARLDAIGEALATASFEEGLAWFAEHPQEGNAYNFSKEVSTVYALAMGFLFAHNGIRINAVLPGPVETPILADFEESMGKETLDGLKRLLGRHATADDVAKAIMFVASDDASWVNGHALVVDGGVTGSVLTGVIPMPQI
ncbi:MAG: coniferyl-alcohol dehydrogenase [Mycobacterium kyogaense]|uniref:coniferyl-alcohol dehydrogenase n=1 Tax=Mycobacterium kyogaense TaxID=2212479 RepID=UPI002FFC3B82